MSGAKASVSNGAKHPASVLPSICLSSLLHIPNLEITQMQRITFGQVLPVRLLTASLLLALSLGVPLETSPGFLQQYQPATLSGDVVIADMDDFADYLYDRNGQNYDSNDRYRLYRVTQDGSRTYNFAVDQDDQPVLVTAPSFIEVREGQNPLGRDTDELPDDPNDIGRDHRKGDLSWVLVTSFLQDQAGTGKVWAVPRDRDDRDNAYVLVGGLQTPTGVCFDTNHDFLYVCDPAAGAIYQYVIDWDGEDKFVLDSDMVATIMQGISAYDCSVDAFGNLYYVDSVENSISIIGYLDLWAGYVAQNRTLYQAEGDDGLLASPVAIDVYNSDTIYYINNVNSTDAGLLNSASTSSSTANSGDITVVLRENRTSWGLAVSRDFAYFSSTDGSVRLTQIWAYRVRGSTNLYLKSSGFFTDPRGICYGDGRVYVADFEIGEVFYFKDNRREEEDPKGFVRLEGAYGLECVNG